MYIKISVLSWTIFDRINSDFSSLSKEQLISLLQQNDREIAELKIKVAAHDTTLAVVREQMENIHRTASAIYGTDTYLADAPNADLSKLVLLLSEKLFHSVSNSNSKKEAAADAALFANVGKENKE